MKKYNIILLDDAELDMIEIYKRIERKSHNPDKARRQYQRIVTAVDSLETFPKMYSLLNTEHKSLKKMRRMLVDNYAVIYTVEDETVIIVGVFSSRSDYISRLKDMYTPGF